VDSLVKNKNKRGETKGTRGMMNDSYKTNYGNIRSSIDKIPNLNQVT